MMLLELILDQPWLGLILTLAVVCCIACWLIMAEPRTDKRRWKHKTTDGKVPAPHRKMTDQRLKEYEEYHNVCPRTWPKVNKGALRGAVWPHLPAGGDNLQPLEEVKPGEANSDCPLWPNCDWRCQCSGQKQRQAQKQMPEQQTEKVARHAVMYGYGTPARDVGFEPMPKRPSGPVEKRWDKSDGRARARRMNEEEVARVQKMAARTEAERAQRERAERDEDAARARRRREDEDEITRRRNDTDLIGIGVAIAAAASYSAPSYSAPEPDPTPSFSGGGGDTGGAGASGDFSNG